MAEERYIKTRTTGGSEEWISENNIGVSMVYPGAGIALSTGTAWGTPITNNSANWNTAFGWGDHSGAGYAPLASPTFTTQITTPTIYGSAAADGDITIKGTSHATKTTSYVKIQEDGGNVVIGAGGDANIRCLITQGALTDGLRVAADTEANFRLRGGATGEADIYLGANGVDNYAIWSTYAERGLKFSSVISGSWVEKARFDSAGNFMLGFTSGLGKFSVNGGVHIGGESDAGDNNLLVDGEIKGASLKTTNWTFEESGNDLLIKRGATTLFKLFSTGVMQAADNIQGGVTL